MQEPSGYSLGVDYGTNSVRALLVDVATGEELATSVYPYPSGKEGILVDRLDPNLARQNPADYIKGFVASVSRVVETASRRRSFDPERVLGIGIDTTGSTPIPVDRSGMPLAMRKEFRKHPAAQAWLWKDHTAHAEAAEITDLARRKGAPYLRKCGGVYSSEWFWSKILHCRRTSPDVFREAFSWVECCDFVPAYLIGNTDPLSLPRSICAAGHKAMFSEEWGGLPAADFLAELSPDLAALRERLYSTAYPSDRSAGRLRRDVARKVGLPAGIPVAVGAFDAHHGAVGAGIRPGRLVKIIGTSTCDMMVAPMADDVPDIPGICGIVPGSIVPGMVGLEAGQSAVGDIFKWYMEHLCPAEYARQKHPFKALGKQIAAMRPGESGLVALDWNNGNRTVLVDPLLTGLLVGQTLHTTAPEILRTLFEATAFGALTIIRRFEANGIKVREIVACGGIAEKDAVMMQILSDVCNRPIKLAKSAQTCALGAAIFGAVAGGGHRALRSAQRAMGGTRPGGFKPSRSAARRYDALFEIYRDLHDGFGKTGRHPPMDDIMKRLIRIRDKARSERPSKP